MPDGLGLFFHNQHFENHCNQTFCKAKGAVALSAPCRDLKGKRNKQYIIPMQMIMQNELALESHVMEGQMLACPGFSHLKGASWLIWERES